MVAPEREKPGISASACAAPTPNACGKLTCRAIRVSSSAAVWGARRRSASAPKSMSPLRTRKNDADCAEAKTLAQSVLEKQAEDAGGDRADDEQPAELRVRVVRSDPAVAKAPADPPQDPHPVSPEEDEQDDCGRQVRGHEEGDEVVVVLMDVPAQKLREDDAVSEARDREELRHPLEQAQDDRLPVGDRRRGDHERSRCCDLSPPVWNQA